MNVRETLSHGDTPMYQIWYAKVKPKKVMGWTRKHIQNPINLTLRSKFKVESGSKIYATHYLMMIHPWPCAKIWLAKVKPKKSYGSDTNLQRRTDRQTDGQTVIPIFPPELR